MCSFLFCKDTCFFESFVYLHERVLCDGCRFSLGPHNKVSRLPLFFYDSMKRQLFCSPLRYRNIHRMFLHALGAARQGEGLG